MADYTVPTATGATTSTSYIEQSQTSSNPAASAPNNALDQADFLRLLTTQLQNQDPSDPMDPTQFVTDMTQMSQLEATTKMNESILAMTTSFQNMQTMQAASMIGKNVQVNGNDFSHTAGEPSPLTLNLDQPLQDVTVVISDDDGMVQEIFLDDLSSGEEIVDWDGLDQDGNQRGSGVYSLTVYGTDEEGEVQMVDTIVGSRVNTVSIADDSTVTLTLATGERVSMDEVREIGG
ncbi:flagellar hook capping protein [Thiomicrorhabdus sp. 6S2-11]|jgi:flagellar basal-body rod modification protein FlgD|uniref:Basal-body rod modification protein FlgD n=1 Tax=Thiomicrorhabdus marina TaxID=2818442 RepID=A0ABS3Q845_9GAMM|nr:flagellar hook capping FlgD N-terminal domain-containing protein [Thiomicrorhabdus marina]MBO1928447.1 flagellar hook capping protein [Thiomicrorhabdus marina]